MPTTSRTRLAWRQGRRPRVLVLGGGFAGLEVCRRLARCPCDIQLLDRQNHHLFQPLLYQVATAGLSGADIAQPLRGILAGQRNVEVHRLTIEGIDLTARAVSVAERAEPIPYDHLVIALGMVTNWFGRADWAGHAVGLKNLHDAYRIRDRILGGAERAENLDGDSPERRRLLTTVIVGAGPTGVEMAGAVAELVRHGIETDFRRLDPATVRVILVSSDTRPLGGFPERLSARAAADLASLGVELRFGCRVRDIVADGAGAAVVLDDGPIPAHTVVWAAGVRAPALTATLGLPLDRAGRIVVSADCSLPGHPESFAVGDIASMPWGASSVPGVAQGAIQSGAFVGRLLGARISAGSAARTFVYRDRGSMATIGRARAVAEIGGRCFQGTLAWILWLAVHVMFLVDLRSRLTVFMKWIAAYAFYRPANCVVAAPVDDALGAASVPAERGRADHPGERR